MSDDVTLPILYSFRRCPYAMRARLAIVQAGFICELREVKLATKPAAMLEASPKGTVPVLVLPGGSVLEESLDIMYHVLSHHDPERWLARNDEKLIASCDNAFKRDLDRYKYPNKYNSDAAAHRRAGMAYLQVLESRLAQHPELCGAQRGLADMAILPFVRQFSAIEPTWFAAQPLPRLHAWLARHLDTPLFHEAMVRQSTWQPGDSPVLFAGPDDDAHRGRRPASSP